MTAFYKLSVWLLANRPSHLKNEAEKAPNTLGFLFLAQELKFLTLKQREPFNFIQQVSLGQTLLIGEGNFSFALSLVKLQPGLSRNIHASVPVAQVHVSDQAKINAATLKKEVSILFTAWMAQNYRTSSRPTHFKPLFFNFQMSQAESPCSTQIQMRFLRAAF